MAANMIRCFRCKLLFETTLASGAGGASRCPRCGWPGPDTRTSGTT
jgi:DNA-directed RNA polymerase subunit RPC12/RpoP